MKCPWCGNDVTRNEGETTEEFRDRWEAEACDEDCEEKIQAMARGMTGR